MTSQVIRPSIPYAGYIPNGLQNEKIIKINGYVPYGADVFRINFVTGIGETPDHPLHISVRFNERVVVRNNKQHNVWDTEERHGPFPFQAGRNFLLIIRVKPSCYKISVDQQHCWDFQHRIPISKVNSIFIDGSVQIEKIEFIDGKQNPVLNPIFHSYPYASIPVQPPVNPHSATVYNPTIPYAYPIYGGLVPGMMFYISAKPSSSAYRFTLNFQGGPTYFPQDIPFHFDVRFYNHSVVRNTRTSNEWGREETMISHFLFQPNVNFDMMIRVESDRYRVALNGQHFVDYRHRLLPLSCVDTLHFSSDIIVTSVRSSYQT